MTEISGLSYIVAETTELGKWQDYAENVLGMMACEAPAGGLVPQDGRAPVPHRGASW